MPSSAGCAPCSPPASQRTLLGSTHLLGTAHSCIGRVLSNSTEEVEERVILAGYNKHSFYISQTGTIVPTESSKFWNSPAVFFGLWCAVSGQKLSHAFGLNTSAGLLCQGNFAHYEDLFLFYKQQGCLPLFMTLWKRE